MKLKIHNNTLPKIDEDTPVDTMSIYYANFLGQDECRRIAKDIHDIEYAITKDSYESRQIPYQLISAIVLNHFDEFDTLIMALDNLQSVMQVAIRRNNLLTLEYFLRADLLGDLPDLASYVYVYSNSMALKLLLRYPKIKKIMQDNISRITSRPKMDIIRVLYKHDIVLHDYMVYEFVKMLLSRQYYNELLTLNEYDQRIIETVENIYTDTSAKCLLPYLDKFQRYLLKLNSP